MNKSLIILFCFLFLGISKSFSQNDFTNNSFFGAIGVGSSNNSVANGLGIALEAGYQKTISHLVAFNWIRNYHFFYNQITNYSIAMELVSSYKLSSVNKVFFIIHNS